MPEATGSPQWHLFDQFWSAYPKRYHRMAAWEEWRKIRPQPDQALLDRILATLTWQKKDPAWNKDGGKWIPWPSSWLRDKRWTDEPFEPQSSMPVRQESERQRPMTKGEAISQANNEALRKVIERIRQRSS